MGLEKILKNAPKGDVIINDSIQVLSIIHNLMKKISRDDNVLPKALIMKYIMDDKCLAIY